MNGAMNGALLNTKRRFIAGAVCPRCQAMDTIVMWREEGVDHRECVSCDFAEEAVYADSALQRGRGRSAQEQPAQELPTRVNRPAAPAPRTAGEADVQIVKILDPGVKR